MFCGGDIRKAIMQLQFWFQSKLIRGILGVNFYIVHTKNNFSPIGPLVKD